MKKMVTKTLAIASALTLGLSMMACGGSGSGTPSGSENAPAGQQTEANVEETRSWKGFHGWKEENFDAKDISYQFTGFWDMGDATYGIAFSFLMNLYEDGSVQVNQYQAPSTDYRYYGSWEKVEDPDGDELHINIAEETNVDGELIDHKYSYVVYEEADGGFSFGYDFGIAPGQYFRVANLAGKAGAEYKDVAAFQTAAADGAFVVAAETEAAAGETKAEGEAQTETKAEGETQAETKAE